jgi:hypothetical protein
MSDSFKQNIGRAVRAGVSYDVANIVGREIENISFANPLYEASLLKVSTEDETISPYFRFKGYSRLSEKQKLIEEIIRQAELYHEDTAGVKAIKYVQERSILDTRFKYLNSGALVFVMKLIALDTSSKYKEQNITEFFEKANNAFIPPLDIFRYYRYMFNDSLDLELNIDIGTSGNVKIGSPKCIEKYNKNQNLFKKLKISKETNNYIDLYKNENEKLYIENEEGENEPFKLELYRNDTLETIKMRYAYLNEIPFEMVKVYTIDSSDVENEKIVEGVKLKFLSNKIYKINDLEDKKVIVNSIIDVIENIPIILKSTESILESIDKISEECSTLFNIQKSDIYYLYLLIRYQIFEGKSIDVNPDQIIDDIENNIEYLELLLAKPIDKNKFYNTIQNYINSYSTTQSIGKKYSTEDDSNSILQELTNLYNLETDNHNNSNSSLIKETDFTIFGEFKLNGIDLYEIFNKIQSSRKIPFTNLNNFYKALNEIKVPTEWCKPELENADTLRIYFYPQVENELYCVAEISQISTEKGINSYTYNIFATIDFDLNTIINSFIDVLPFLPKEMTVQKEFGKGYFLLNLDNIVFQEDVFYDFCMNNKIASEMFSIDEKYKIHKIRGGLKFAINKNLLNTDENVKCIIKTKKIEKSTEQEIKDFPNFAKVGKESMIISISGNIHFQTLEFYKKMIENLLYFINKNKQDFFINYYCNFIQNIKDLIKVEKKTTEITKDLALKEIVPDLFLSGYVRSCSYPPSILLNPLSDSEIDKKKVMVFPKHGSQQTSFQYVCDKDTKKVYPGLRMNDMENTDIYPVVPCCYQDDQTSKGTIRYNYENDIKFDTDALSGTATFITTRKLLKPLQEGALPPTIKNLLTMTDNSALLNESQFIRIHVPKSPFSIIEALKIATKSKLSDKDILQLINKYTTENLLCQSGLEIEDALQIVNNKAYMDIKDWCPILEHIFNVKIAIFLSRKEEGILSHQNYNRYLILPSKSHYSNMILILNTTGGEFDRIDYPHNELIVKKNNKTKEYTYLFNIESETAKAIESIYRNIIKTVNINLPTTLKIDYQKQDGFGKIRELYVDNYIIYTSPIYPISNGKKFDIPVTNTIKTEMPVKKALEMMKIYNIEDNNLSIIEYKNKKIALVGEQNTFYFVIRLKQNDLNLDLINDFPIYPVQNEGYLIPPSDELSFIKRYNYYIRLSNYITSYACYLYSYLKSKNNELTIKEFEKSIKIDKTINYGKLNRLISIENNSIIKNEKLIIENEDIKLRTLFYLEMLQTKSEKSIDDYYLLKYIPNYYNHADDFDKSQNFTVYNNLEEYIETRRLKKAQYALYDRLFKSNVTFFFASPHFFEETNYLAIPAPTMAAAVNRSLYYTKTGNIVYNAPPSSEKEYGILVQDEDDIDFEGDLESESWIGKYVLRKNKVEEYYFSLIKI